jgi:hypothetical protein
MRRIWGGSQMPALTFVRRLRTVRRYQSIASALQLTVFPNLFGLMLLVVILLTSGVAAVRMLFDGPMLVGRVCSDVPPDGAREVGADPLALDRFDSTNMCQATGFVLRKGVSYKIRITPPQPHWMDGSYPVDGLDGVSSHAWIFYVAIPLRRHLRVNWFVPIARVGSQGDEYFPLTRAITIIEPQTNGQLFFYVNDGLSITRPNPFYANNQTVGAPVTFEVKAFDKDAVAW